MSEAERSEDLDDEILGKVSDFLDGALTGPERDDVARRVQDDPAWQRVHAELLETREALSGLQKARAPATFAQDVTSTIHKRSAGRFFARRTLGDRVPFGAILVVALIALALIGYVLWASPTGSLESSRHEGAGPPHPAGSGELLPRP